MSRRPARGKRPNQHDAEAETSTPVKLQKVLAEAGLGSRREMERWIESGRIEVNGETAHLGQRVGPSDRIRADGRLLGRGSSHGSRVLLYNKPAGVVCTRRDPEGRPTVFDKLPELNRGRWISIGRLDIASSGLLLLTNDGALANTMMHPSTGLDREYAVRVNGELSSEDMARALAGVDDDGERLAFSDIQHYAGSGHNHWYHVALLEGKNREIRRVFAQLGYSVSRLKRVRFGPVVLPSRLSRGRSAELERDDLKALYKLLKLPVPEMPAERRRRGKPAPSVLIPYPELHQRS
jgi:23S rRNA pseudouridine2605 synthase